MLGLPHRTKWWIFQHTTFDYINQRVMGFFALEIPKKTHGS